ncbi:MAG: cytochrome c3 family protein [Lentisphaerae bacterium]|nr:cytochrome c3 family protein [Lentisphaerota bacterium]
MFTVPGVRDVGSRFGRAAWLGVCASVAVNAGTLNLYAAGDDVANDTCFACHADAEDAPRVDAAVLAGSVHAELACVDCHAAITELPHPEKMAAVACATCHADEGAEYASSIHGMSNAMGSSGAAGCTDCHGTHGILAAKDPASPVFKLNLPQTCAKCHSSKALTQEYRMKYPEAAAQYGESIHGRALLKLGLIVAPSCNDCHGVHNIRRTVDRSSPIHHSNVAKTCGKCHVTVEKIYNASVHGQLLAKGGQAGPVCIDCHTAHEIESPTDVHFKQVSDQRCGRCHEDRLKYYHETYHGKAMALGKPNVASDVAACYDCHGHHDVLPPSDPASRLSTNNIVNTCRQCHPKANDKFVTYIPHANHLDKIHYPALHWTFVFMTALLVGTFGVFGIHTAFWVFRSGYLYRHDSKAFREIKVRAQTGDEWFTRFLPFERMLHFMLVTSFLLLVMTGMPLKFYEAQWARFIFNLLGGAAVARSLHHFAGFILFLCFALHVTKLLKGAWLHRGRYRSPDTGRWSLKLALGALVGPDSMIPTAKDWRDFIAHQKWFFGKGPRPQFDRWTYWEKFDYLAVFWGVFAIGLSGLIMWFPEFFTRFMPGWVINIALIIHSDEALLAAGFIFTFHFFNTHFRLEKFPMDTVIFSGRISKTEMLHERERWYDRLVSEGRLDEHRVRDEWMKWRNIHRTFGYTFFGIGLVLLALIVYAMASRLHAPEEPPERPAAVSAPRGEGP